MSIINDPTSSSDLPPETVAQIRVDGMTRRYWELKGLIAEAEREAKFLHDALADHCRETGEVIEVEGLPPLQLHREGAGTVWDSWAVEKMQSERPAEWERIVALGAVKLDLGVMRKAIQGGQLVGLPAGGVEKIREVLRFDVPRR